MKGRILIIAGSDSGGGAGIQADLKTVMALGGYATTTITAITAQNTQGVEAVFPVPPEIVAKQMEAVLEDIGADVLKTGMLHDAALIEAIIPVLESKTRDIPLVVDPVMQSKDGHALLEENALSVLKKKLLPRAAVITPNIPEAEKLLACKIKNANEMPDAARELGRLGAKAVLLKGGHLPGEVITDILWDGNTITSWQSPRIISKNTHGTGCTLASAVAVSLAQGQSLKKAVERARDYVQGAIRHATPLGHGNGPLNHGWMSKK